MALTKVTVIAPMGLRIDESTSVVLPESMMRRFADCVETNERGKPKRRNGAHVLTRSITLKNGLQLEVDLDSLTKRQQEDLDWEGRNAPAEKKAAPAGENELTEEQRAELQRAALAEWNTLNDEQRAQYGNVDAFTQAYIEASTKPPAES